MTPGQPDERPRPGEDVAAKFTAAWEVFSRTCMAAVAPEATFQAWFAHYLISQFGIDRVAREPNFRHWKMFAPSPFIGRFKGKEIKLDVVVTRRPGIDMPHWVHRSDSKHGGTALLGDLAVISELKVASTQGAGLRYTEVCKDVWKLSMLQAPDGEWAQRGRVDGLDGLWGCHRRRGSSHRCTDAASGIDEEAVTLLVVGGRFVADPGR